MMGEKRFKLKENLEDVLIEDTITQSQYSIYGIVDLLNEQQATINILLEELINAQQQGYVVDFLHKNERCNLTPKELEDE